MIFTKLLYIVFFKYSHMSLYGVFFGGRALWRGFHTVTSREIIRLLRATARWKVETRSFPTRRWNPLSDLYIQSYDLYHPEIKYCVWANLSRVEVHNMAE